MPARIPRKSLRHRHFAAVALTAAVAASLSACTSSGSKTDAAHTSPSAGGAATSTAAGSTGGAVATAPASTTSPAAGSSGTSAATGSATPGSSTGPSAGAGGSAAASASSGPSASSSGTPEHHAVPFTRAVHITGAAWAYKPKHDAVMALLKAHKINAVEIDIKDESGIVNYKSTVPLATTIGAIAPYYDPAKMIKEIHDAGGRVIGRLVVFHDSKLAKWAWQNGHKDDVLQTASRQPWTGSYGDFSFSNFASPTVQQYNVDLSVEAAKDGFDDVLFDYVRRADGKLSEMYIPDLGGASPEASVAGFVRKTREAFTQAGVKTLLGASVFGISATRPKEIAQNIPMMAPYLDYVSPMVYPSHWGSDEYGLKSPITHPYEIVQRSLKDFQKDVKGTSAIVVPWLQAFSLDGVTYGPAQVHQQEQAAHDDGLDSYLLWNAGANYDTADLPVISG